MDEWEFAEPVDVLSKLPENFQENVESKKWLERKEALEAFLALLNTSPKLDPKANYNEMINLLKTMLLKDANINVNALAAKCLTLMAKGLRQKFAPFAMDIASAIFEKFKEKRKILLDELILCIDAVYDCSNLDTLSETIQGALSKPNPQIKAQTSQFLYRVFVRFTSANVPNKHVKAFAPLLVKLLSESDPEVRDSSSSALGSMMKSIHEKNMETLVGEVASDKNKWSKIIEYREKAEKDYAEWLASQPKPTASAPSSRNETATTATTSAAATVSKAAPAAVDPWEFLEPVDIIKDMSKSFYEDIQSKKWQERKEALETLLELLNKNPRLDVKAQYSDVITALNNMIKNDANINVGSTAVKCVAHFANGLRKAFHPHINSITPIVLEKFKEKKPMLRDPLAECIDAIYATTSLDHISEHVIAALGNKNPNVKIQTCLFLYRVFKNFGPTTAPKKQVKEMTPLIVKLTIESDPEVRDAACAALGAIMKSIGKKAALPLISDVATDKLKMAKIEEFHDKAVAEAGPEIVAEMIQSIHKQDNQPKENGALLKNGKPVVRPGVKPAAKPTAAEDNGLQENGFDGEEPLKPVGRPGKPDADGDVTARQSAANRRRSKSRTSMAPQEAKAPEAPPAPTTFLISESDRNGRAKDEKNLKLLKWNFDAPTVEHVQQLTAQFTDVCKIPLSQQLFSKDFKMHLKAIDYMQQLLNTDPICVLNNVDLILKWMTLRFFDTNPAVLLRGLEFITAIFEYMDSSNEKLLDTEMAAFLPYMLIKSGEPKDAVRISVKKIVRLIGGLCPAAKIFPLVLDALKTKNSRQKAECLQIADHFLECLGTNVAPNPQLYMKTIAGCIADRDSNVRNSALNAITTVYKRVGDKVYSLIGKLDDKEKAMLDERIRRTGRDTTQVFEPEMVENDNTIRLRETPKAARQRPPSKERAMEQNFTDRMNALLDQNHRRPLPENDSAAADKYFSLGSKFMDLPSSGSENVPFSLRNTDTMNLDAITPAILSSSSTRGRPRRADSMSSMSSITSVETQEQLDRVIYGISSVTIDTVLESIHQLHFILTDENQQIFLIDRSDLLIKTVVTQLSVIRNQHLADSSNTKETNELLRTLSNFLHTFATTSMLAERLTQHTLKSLMSEFLMILCDPRIAQLPNSHEIIKSLNLIVAKFCEHSNPNQCFSALIRLLMGLLDSDHSNKSISLLMKCIFKQLEFLQQRLDKIEIDKFLQTYHEFFKKFPAEQNPHLKEILTPMQICLQRLVLLTRPQITEFLHVLPADSFVVTYIKRCLRAIERKEAEKGITQPPKSGPGLKLEKLLQNIGTNLVHGSIEQLYNYLENNPNDRPYVEKFAQDNKVDFDILFDSIKKRTAKGEPVKPVDSIKPFLKSDDMEYFERQRRLGHRFEEILEQMEVKPPTASGISHSHSNTTISSTTNGFSDGIPSSVMTASDLQPSYLNESVVQPKQTPVTTQQKRPKRLSQMEIAAFKERLENIRRRDEE